MLGLPVLVGAKAVEIYADLRCNLQHGSVTAHERSMPSPPNDSNPVPVTTFDQDATNVCVVLWTNGISHRFPVIGIGRSTRAKVPNDQRAATEGVRTSPISGDGLIINLGVGRRWVEHS